MEPEVPCTVGVPRRRRSILKTAMNDDTQDMPIQPADENAPPDFQNCNTTATINLKRRVSFALEPQIRNFGASDQQDQASHCAIDTDLTNSNQNHSLGMMPDNRGAGGGFPHEQRTIIGPTDMDISNATFSNYGTSNRNYGFPCDQRTIVGGVDMDISNATSYYDLGTTSGNGSRGLRLPMSNRTILGAVDMDITCANGNIDTTYKTTNPGFSCDQQTVVGGVDMDISNATSYYDLGTTSGNCNRSFGIPLDHRTIIGGVDMDISNSYHHNDVMSDARGTRLPVGNRTILGAVDMDITSANGETEPAYRNRDTQSYRNTDYQNRTVFGGADMDISNSSLADETHGSKTKHCSIIRESHSCQPGPEVLVAKPTQNKTHAESEGSNSRPWSRQPTVTIQTTYGERPVEHYPRVPPLAKTDSRFLLRHPNSRSYQKPSVYGVFGDPKTPRRVGHVFRPILNSESQGQTEQNHFTSALKHQPVECSRERANMSGTTDVSIIQLQINNSSMDYSVTAKHPVSVVDPIIDSTGIDRTGELIPPVLNSESQNQTGQNHFTNAMKHQPVECRSEQANMGGTTDMPITQDQIKNSNMDYSVNAKLPVSAVDPIIGPTAIDRTGELTRPTLNSGSQDQAAETHFTSVLKQQPVDCRRERADMSGTTDKSITQHQIKNSNMDYSVNAKLPVSAVDPIIGPTAVDRTGESGSQDQTAETHFTSVLKQQPVDCRRERANMSGTTDKSITQRQINNSSMDYSVNTKHPVSILAPIIDSTEIDQTGELIRPIVNSGSQDQIGQKHFTSAWKHQPVECSKTLASTSKTTDKSITQPPINNASMDYSVNAKQPVSVVDPIIDLTEIDRTGEWIQPILNSGSQDQTGQNHFTSALKHQPVESSRKRANMTGTTVLSITQLQNYNSSKDCSANAKLPASVVDPIIDSAGINRTGKLIRPILNSGSQDQTGQNHFTGPLKHQPAECRKKRSNMNETTDPSITQLQIKNSSKDYSVNAKLPVSILDPIIDSTGIDRTGNVVDQTGQDHLNSVLFTSPLDCSFVYKQMIAPLFRRMGPKTVFYLQNHENLAGMDKIDALCGLESELFQSPTPDADLTKLIKRNQSTFTSEWETSMRNLFNNRKLCQNPVRELAKLSELVNQLLGNSFQDVM